MLSTGRRVLTSAPSMSITQEMVFDEGKNVVDISGGIRNVLAAARDGSQAQVLHAVRVLGVFAPFLDFDW